MKIAVTFKNGEIFEHFGHSEAFKVYEIENNTVIASQLMDTNGNGHGALAQFLKDNTVDTLICGGIGGGAKTALANAGITLYGGVCGNADQAVADFLAGSLKYNAAIECNHHGHGEGKCGESCQ